MFDNPNALLLSFVIGSVGLVAFMYGKRQARVPQMAAGIVLMVYPYFVADLLLMGGIAVAVLAGLWAAIRAGY